MQSVGLASAAYKDTEKKKFKPVKSAVRSIVGIQLTKATANQVAAFP